MKHRICRVAWTMIVLALAAIQSLAQSIYEPYSFTTIAGLAGDPGSADGTGNAARFVAPSGCALDSGGNVYVTDSFYNTIRKVTPTGVVTTLAGLAQWNDVAGSPVSGSVDGTGSTARFSCPLGVAVDSAGNVYVADRDNHTIRKVTPAGAVTTLAGLAGNPGSADGTGNAARFVAPSGCALDSGGNVYVTDSFYNTIRKVTPTGVVTTLAGLAQWNDVAGSPVSGSVDGTGSTARFSCPLGVAVDSAGNVYVADRDNHTIRKVTPAGAVTTLAGLAGNPGSADGTGNAARFVAPSGCALDSGGNVYVTDSFYNTIRKVTPTGVVTTLAGLAQWNDVAGSPVSGSVDGTGSTARFSCPLGVAVDSAGNVYVADRDNHTIRKVTPAGAVTTLAGLAGNPGSADGTGNAARFVAPSGCALDSGGNVYVTDSFYNTIRKVTPTGVVTTLAGLAQWNDVAGSPVSGSVDGTGSTARFSCPLGVAVDSAGNVYVADRDNHTIRKGEVASMDTLDAKPLFCVGVIFPTSDPDAPLKLTFASESRQAAVADGATKVLLRVRAPVGGTASFYLENGIAGDGLNKIDSGGAPSWILTDVPAFKHSDKSYFFYALYTVPDGMLVGETTHTVTFKMTITAPGGAQTQLQKDFKLVRPPVLLVHGTWSTPDVWRQPESRAYDLITEAGFRVETVDWAALGAASFAAKDGVFFPKLNLLNALYEAEGIAFTRADVVAHSQGGNLVRIFAQQPWFRTADNFGAGYFRRFIGLAVPHLGTEFANQVCTALATADPEGRKQLVAFAEKVLHAPILGGAIEDLKVGSPAFRSIGPTDLASHMITDECGGTGSLGLKCGRDGLVALLLAYFRFHFGWDLVPFQGLPNDTVVSVPSQKGGLGGVNETHFTGVIHTELPGNVSVINRVIELLNRPSVSGVYAPRLDGVQAIYDSTKYDLPYRGDPPDCKPSSLAPSLSTIQQPRTLSGSAATIILASPTNGALILPGSNLDVSIQQANGASVSSVFLALANGTGSFVRYAILDQGSFRTNFNIPTNLIGALTIQAFAKLSDGSVSPTPLEATVQVQTKAELQSLTVQPESLFFISQGATEQLSVSGMFADGVQRSMTGSTALQFTNSNPGIITVSSNGLVKALGNGVATITVTSGKAKATAAVEVRFQPPQILSFEPAAVAVRAGLTTITLHGANLGGASSLQFLTNGVPDKSILTTNLTVGSFGSVVTAQVQLSSNVVVGTRTAVITTAGGQSSTNSSRGNAFEIIAPGMEKISLAARLSSDRSKIEVTFTGLVGGTYSIESSSNLTSWREETTVTSTGGETTFRQPIGEQHRFLRVRIVPRP